MIVTEEQKDYGTYDDQYRALYDEEPLEVQNPEPSNEHSQIVF